MLNQPKKSPYLTQFIDQASHFLNNNNNGSYNPLISPKAQKSPISYQNNSNQSPYYHLNIPNSPPIHNQKNIPTNSTTTFLNNDDFHQVHQDNPNRFNTINTDYYNNSNTTKIMMMMSEITQNSQNSHSDSKKVLENTDSSFLICNMTNTNMDYSFNNIETTPPPPQSSSISQNKRIAINNNSNSGNNSNKKKKILKGGEKTQKSSLRLNTLENEDDLAEFIEKNQKVKLNSCTLPSGFKSDIGNSNESGHRMQPLTSPSRKTMKFIEESLRHKSGLSTILKPFDFDDKTKSAKSEKTAFFSFTENQKEKSDCMIFTFLPILNLSTKDQSKNRFNIEQGILNTNLCKVKSNDKKIIIKRSLEDLRVISNILDYLDLAGCISFLKSYRSYDYNKKYRKIFTNHVFKCLCQSVKDEDLYYYFKYVINFPYIMRLHPHSYHNKSTQKSLYQRDIVNDIDRTFSKNGYFETSFGRDSLKKVLIAISNTKKDVGYIQGLNCIVGSLLLYLSEEESYWTILYFLEKLDVKSLFNQDFKNINILNYQLQCFCQYYFPEISDYLNEKQMEVSYFSTAWFITLFANVFTHKFVIKCWCAFLIKGYPFLIKLALGIFAIHKDDIIQRDCGEAGEYLKNCLKYTQQQVFELSIKFKVTKQMLITLKKFYYSPKKHRQLKLKPIGNKLHWIEYLETDHDNNNNNNNNTHDLNFNSTNDLNQTICHYNNHFHIDSNDHSPLSSVKKYIGNRENKLVKQNYMISENSKLFDSVVDDTIKNDHLKDSGNKDKERQNNQGESDFSKRINHQNNMIQVRRIQKKKLSKCYSCSVNGNGSSLKIKSNLKNKLEKYKMSLIYDSLKSEESDTQLKKKSTALNKNYSSKEIQEKSKFNIFDITPNKDSKELNSPKLIAIPNNTNPICDADNKISNPQVNKNFNSLESKTLKRALFLHGSKNITLKNNNISFDSNTQAKMAASDDKTHKKVMNMSSGQLQVHEKIEENELIDYEPK